MNFGTKLEVVADGKVGEEDVVLGDKSDSSLSGTKVGDVPVVEVDTTSGDLA